MTATPPLGGIAKGRKMKRKLQMINLTRRHALALGSGTLLVPSLSRAQAAWPAGPVTFVVGYAAGGSTDINARELGNVMTPVIGQQIIIDNKGGAAGSIGLRAAALPSGRPNAVRRCRHQRDHQPVRPEGHDRYPSPAWRRSAR